MRLPRPQISLKSSLLAIAIVAINCAAYRCLLDAQSRDGLRFLLAILPDEFVVGVIPLLEVAMIGALLCESDLEKPRTGLPRLPARVWLKFLFREASLRNQDGLLRLGIERLLGRRTNPGIPRTDL
jgi:hypothetical protein